VAKAGPTSDLIFLVKHGTAEGQAYALWSLSLSNTESNQKTLVDEDADIDAADEDDEDLSNAPRSARAVKPGSSTSAASRSTAPSHTASWVPWAELPNLGLTLSAQKIAELVVGRPLAKSSTRATVASTSNMFGGSAAAGVQAAPPARLAAASTGKSKAVPDAANGESKSKKSKTQVSSPATTASAFFGKRGV
jgi:hypothetical protein